MTVICTMIVVLSFPGCSGALARELAKEYPSSSVIVFDLPQVVETAQKHFSEQDDAIVFQSGEAILKTILFYHPQR